MKQFMDKDFLLYSDTAKTLYHQYAKDMPIFDYHCHVSVAEIAEDKAYDNITQIWLGGDHYKWRAMRLAGIDEQYITGGASDLDKFVAYASVVGSAIGNPLYHWTHLELQRYFGIYDTLTRDNAVDIYNRANKVIAGGLTTRKLIGMSGVARICSTDDPADDLRYHKALQKQGYSVAVTPTFRPDKAVEICHDTFVPYMAKLGSVVGFDITSYAKLLEALDNRMDFFHSVGCRLADISVDVVPFAETNMQEVSQIFDTAVAGGTVTASQEVAYKFYTLQQLAVGYARRSWTMQIHIGALRNNNSVMFSSLGGDCGFDSIGDNNIAYGLSKFLDACNSVALPKTIIYPLNPRDNYVVSTMMGNFATSGIASKVQHGSAWWFNDQRDGMLEQMRSYANLGLLSKFVGMLTDSRSFTSYVRHEYFRRILCDMLGQLVESGQFPCDYTVLGTIVEDICYNNIVNFFDAK